MKDKNTEDLDKILENIKPEELNQFLKDNKDYLANGKKAFYYYMKDMVEDKKLKLKDIYIAIDETEKWGSRIFTQERHTTNRDLIIRICIAAHFNKNETNRALKLYGMQPLYAKDMRDAHIIIALNNRIYDFDRIDELLEKDGFRKLSKEIKE